MNNQQLVEENMNLVYFLINKHYPTFILDEDVIQSGMLGLCKAADTWDESKSEFSTYAGRCILNEIYNEFSRRCKHNGTLSLDYTVKQSDGEEADFGEIIAGSEDVDFVDYERFYRELKPWEKKVVEYRQLGLNNREIGEKLGCSANNVSQKVRELRYLWRFVNGN